MQVPFSWQKYELIPPPVPKDQRLGTEVGLGAQIREKTEYPKDSGRKGLGPQEGLHELPGHRRGQMTSKAL